MNGACAPAPRLRPALYVHIFFIQHSTTSCPSHPRAPCEPRSMAIFNQSAVLFSITPQILPQWEGHAGDEVWPGTTTCLKLIFTQTAQDKPFWLFFLGILTEYWNRPSASRWKSGSLKRGFRRHPLKYSFSTNGRISWISLSLKLVGRHQTIFNTFASISTIITFYFLTIMLMRTFWRVPVLSLLR